MEQAQSAADGFQTEVVTTGKVAHIPLVFYFVMGGWRSSPGEPPVRSTGGSLRSTASHPPQNFPASTRTTMDTDSWTLMKDRSNHRNSLPKR